MPQHGADALRRCRHFVNGDRLILLRALSGGRAGAGNASFGRSVRIQASEVDPGIAATSLISTSKTPW